ncbi:MAG: ribbon-helix-helix protein, CopG family [Calditrichaceae bacterium]|nr:CopG family transcriptional regulator [Calditrichia bacterium]NUQ41152.1 ribbon-helix-helix protein, CopG family [Calditrichaceae bacterium]
MSNISDTIRLASDLEKKIRRECQRSGRTRLQIIEDAVRRQLAIAELKYLQEKLEPRFKAAGYDEDRILQEIS